MRNPVFASARDVDLELVRGVFDLLDSTLTSPVDVSLNLHDQDGSVTKTFCLWAAHNGLIVATKHNVHPDLEWTYRIVEFARGKVAVSIAVHGASAEDSFCDEPTRVFHRAEVA